MARIFIALGLSLTLMLTGCAAPSKAPQAVQNDLATEPSPYRSYKWIQHPSWWQTESSTDTPVRDTLVQAGQVATVVAVVSLYVGLFVLFLAAPRAAGSCNLGGLDPTCSPEAWASISQ
jgi:hypothetical protein